jgi:hypothetical protein
VCALGEPAKEPLLRHVKHQSHPETEIRNSLYLFLTTLLLAFSFFSSLFLFAFFSLIVASISEPKPEASVWTMALLWLSQCYI